jgi:hypothetical protein
MTAPLNQIVSVAPRYARAINLERDASSETALEGYVITSTAQALLSRVAASFADAGRHHAWTVTGPYGSGKSAFLLFLAALIGPQATTAGRLARRLLKEQHPDLSVEFASRRALTRDGFCPVLVSGSPGSLITAVLRATLFSVAPYYRVGRRSEAFRELEALSKRRVGEVSPKQLVSAILNLSVSLRETGRARGILFIVDELGKFLEHAAHGRLLGEVFILQELAEATARFKQPTVLLVTVLHQAFEQYASALRPKDRDEWEKIQGRFEDFAFHEPPDQVLQLIGQALSHSKTREGRALREQAREQAERAAELGLTPKAMTPKEFIDTIEKCAPLHPLVALCLARLCRKFGQNQRSLFSFLTSQEPHGFGSFLDIPYARQEVPCYRLNKLHDYVADAFGSALSVGEGAGRWAEAQAALERASGLSSPEVNLIKTIGLLSAVGSHGNLKPSIAVLQFAEGDSSSSIKKKLGSLSDRSVIVERKHSGTVALWEGSDLDLEEQVRDAGRRLPMTGSLAQRANAHWSPRPQVAKRHSYETGTLRYFDAVFADISNFAAVTTQQREADGVIVYAVPANPVEHEQLTTLARTSEARERRDVIVAVPEDSDAFLDAVRHLELLRWVQSHTPELQADAVARRELRSRIAIAESTVAAEARRLFSPDEQLAKRTKWFHHGIERPVRSGRTLAELLSGVCDALYAEAPVLKNELVNRRALSSAAAAARRNVIDAMIRRPDAPRLGFEGNPPEVSIYASLLERTGIHRRVGSYWEFGSPRSDPKLKAVWRRIETFFNECELERRPLTALFETLQAPPYGLRMGVIPVLLCAALLAHDSEVALYEDGAFLPELTIEAFERLLRSPDRFSLRRYRVEGVRREVFRQLAHLLGSSSEEQFNLVAVVRPLYRFFGKLPPYSQKTSAVSAIARAVREALLSAKEPDQLLFDSLPRACGIESLPPSELQSDVSGLFIRCLQQALLELQRSYDDLLADLRALLLRAFGLAADGRLTLQARASVLAPHCIEGRLRAFVHQLHDSELTDVAWIEAIGAVLVGKPPTSWGDVDRARYEVALAELSRAFRHLEALVFEELKRVASGKAATQIFRIGVADRHSREYESVVAIEARDEDRLAETVIRLRDSLDAAGVVDEPQLALAALSMLCRQFLAEIEDQQLSHEPIGQETKHGG